MSNKSIAVVSNEFPSASVALEALDKLELEIQKAPTFKVLDDAARTAAAIQLKYKPVEDVSFRAGEVWCQAEIKLGDELGRVDRAKGTKGQALKPGPGRGKKGKTGGAVIAPPVSDVPTLAEIGLPGDAGKKRAARAKKLASIPEKKRQQITKKLKEEGKGITPNAMLAETRKEAKAEKVHKVATAAFSETGPFDVVVIDPPWPMQKIDRDVRPNQDAFDYPVMTEEELQKWWTDNMAGNIAKECHLFCWTTQKFMPMSLRLIEKWGFRYVLLMVWHKSGGFQPVGLPQYNCEFVMYARKGAPVFVETKDFPCCFEAPRREHSRKPDKFYETIKRVTGGSRVDVFSREKREGFAQYGNETDKFEAD